MRKLLVVIAAVFVVAVAVTAADSAEVARGRDVYQRRCTGCHSLDGAKVGPALRGVFGRRAATDPAFTYSDGLKKTRAVWDAATLDRWLADPDSVAPDNDMAFRLPNPGERAAIIEYLKQLSAPGARN